MRRWELPDGWMSVRFLTFSCQYRLPLFTNRAIASLAVRELQVMRSRHGVRVYAWVVMPEHMHLLVRPGENGSEVSAALRSYKMAITQVVLARWRALKAPVLERVRDEHERPRFWLKGGGFDRNVRDESEFTRKVWYTHRNPVARGLVADPGDWPWSSIHSWRARACGEPVPDLDDPPGPGWDRWRGFE